MKNLRILLIRYWIVVVASIFYSGLLTLLFINVDMHQHYGDWANSILPNHSASTPIDALRLASDAYLTWSSRFFVQASIYFFANKLFLFVILTLCAIALIVYSLCKIFKVESIRDQLVLSALLLVIPISVWQSAGVYATVITYLWPIAAALYAVYVLFTKKPSVTSTVLAMPALIFAACMEQVALFLTIFLSALLLYKKFVAKEKIQMLHILFLIISILGVINALLCPGLGVRKESEITSWFPCFNNIGLFKMLWLTFDDTMNYLMTAPAFVFFVIGLIMVVFRRKAYSRLVLLFPASIGWLATVPVLSTAILPIYDLVSLPANRVGQSSVIDFWCTATSKLSELPLFEKILYVTPTLFYFLVIVSLVIFLFKQFNRKTAFFVIIILTSGIATRVSMAMSPTVFASAERSFIVLLMAVVVTIMIIYRQTFPVRRRAKVVASRQAHG